MSQENNALPFIRVDNHLIAIHRVVSVDYVYNSRVSKVGSSIFPSMELAREHSRETGVEVKEVTMPTIFIHYKNAEDIGDYIRRYGKQAVDLWNNLCGNLVFNDQSTQS